MRTLTHQELGNVGIRLGVNQPSPPQNGGWNAQPPPPTIPVRRQMAHATAHKVFGACEVSMAVTCLALEITSFCVAGSFLAPSHSGFYFGLLLLLTGILALVARQDSRTVLLRPFPYFLLALFTFFACFVGLVFSSIEIGALQRKKSAAQLLPSDARRLQEAKLGVVMLCSIFGAGCCTAQVCLLVSDFTALRDSATRVDPSPPTALVSGPPLRPPGPRRQSYVDATSGRGRSLAAVPNAFSYQGPPIAPPPYDETDDMSQISLPPSYTTMPRRY